jgi:hypothetical protein
VSRSGYCTKVSRLCQCQEIVQMRLKQAERYSNKKILTSLILHKKVVSVQYTVLL